MAKSVLRADTGHKVEPPREGILRILTEFLCWKVFDHFMTMCAPRGPKMTSSLASCSKGMNAAMECGTRFEILKKEKYESKKQLYK